MSSFRKFIIHYSHFFTGSVLSLLLGLVSFPILTRILTREEYGVMGLVSTTMLLVVAAAKAGLSDGIIRFYKSYGDSPERRGIFASTVILRGLVLASLVLVIYLLALFFFGGSFSVTSRYILCFAIMGVYLFIRPMNIIVLNVLRASEKTVLYNAVNLIGKVTSIGLSITLLIYIIGSFYGFFAGLVLSELIVSAILFYWFFSTHDVRPSLVSGGLALNLIKFGIPLLASEMSYLLLSYADRYMIVGYKGEAALGLYSVGYNLASYISDMIMFSLSYAVTPIYVGIYEKDGREKTEAFLRKCAHYMIAAVIPVYFGYLAVSEDLFVTLASEKYRGAAEFSHIILLGSLFLGINGILKAGLYLKKKTTTILVIMAASLALNIALNVVLLPGYGVMGAAVATLVACIVTAVLTVALSFRHINIRLDFKAFIFYTATSAAVFLALTRIETGAAWTNLVLKLFAGGVVFSAVILFKEKEILQLVKARLPQKRADLNG